MRSMLTSTADVNAEAVGVGVTKCHNPQVFVTARIEMRASACKSVVYCGMWIPLGQEGRIRCDERERLVVSGTVRLVSTEVSPLDRQF